MRRSAYTPQVVINLFTFIRSIEVFAENVSCTNLTFIYVGSEINPIRGYGATRTGFTAQIKSDSVLSDQLRDLLTMFPVLI